MKLLRTILLAVLSFALTARLQAEDAKPDTEGIQGTWEIIQASLGGSPVPEKVRTFKYIFHDKQLTVDKGGGDTKSEEYSFTLDPSKKPKSVDLIHLDGSAKGQTILGIYELTGDRLRLCMPNGANKDRPTEFKTIKGTDVGLVVLSRRKQSSRFARSDKPVVSPTKIVTKHEDGSLEVLAKPKLWSSELGCVLLADSEGNIVGNNVYELLTFEIEGKQQSTIWSSRTNRKGVTLHPDKEYRFLIKIKPTKSDDEFFEILKVFSGQELLYDASKPRPNQ